MGMEFNVEEALSLVASGRVVTHNGRSAYDRDGVMFIAAAEGSSVAVDDGEDDPRKSELSKLTVPELRDIAGGLGIDWNGLNKGPLIDSIINVESKPPEV